MRAFYERWLWIMKIFFVEESRLSPRAVRVFVDGGPAACSFLFLYVLGFGFRINDIESQLHVPAHDADEGSFASAHDPLLMHPETLAPSLLPYACVAAKLVTSGL
jgi:hypothetical protein